MMDESSIWAAALLDILAVVPRYRIGRELPTMTPNELRKKALDISKLYDMWAKKVALPTSVTRHPLPVDASRIDLLPGGSLLLILTTLGDLQLYRFLGSYELLDTVPRNALVDIIPGSGQLRRTRTPPGELWAAISSPFRDITDMYNDQTEFRICKVQLDPPSIQVSETFTVKGVCAEICAAGDLLIAITNCEYQQSCMIRRVAFPALKEEGTRVINLSSDMANPRLAMVYPHIILLRAASTLLVYDLESEDDDGTPTLLATNIRDGTGESIAKCLSRYRDSWVPTHYFESIGVRVAEGLRFVSASGSAPDIDFPLDGPYSMGESHTITRVVTFGAGGPVGFQCFSSFIRHDRHPGYMRLGYNQAPSPKHCTYIPLAGRTGFVREVSFDEETGRTCAIFRPSNKTGTYGAEIIVANFI